MVYSTRGKEGAKGMNSEEDLETGALLEKERDGERSPSSQDSPVKVLGCSGQLAAGIFYCIGLLLSYKE